MKRTRKLGTARSFRASRGAFFFPSEDAGGVLGRTSEKAASAMDAIPATVKMLLRARSISAPVLSFNRKTKGQLAAIHPMVPHRRTRPNAFCASFR
jgi:hypothetical protein